MSPSKKQSLDSCMLVGGEGCRKVTELNVLFQSYRETQLAQAESINEIGKELKAVAVSMERFLVRFDQSNEQGKQQSALQDTFRQNIHELDMELQRVMEQVTSAADTLKSMAEYFNGAQHHCSDTRSGFEKRITELESQVASLASAISQLTLSTQGAVDMVASLKGAQTVMKWVNAGVIAIAGIVAFLSSLGIGIRK